MQRKWYRSVLEKDIDAVNGALFRVVRLLLMNDSRYRFDWKERGKNSAHEHGHASKLSSCSFFLLHLNASILAPQSHMPPISFRRRSTYMLVSRCFNH